VSIGLSAGRMKQNKLYFTTNMLDPRTIKGLLFIFVFMSCGLFTWLSIVDHFTGIASYTFGEMLRISVFTGIFSSALFYWWAVRSESDGDDTPSKTMPIH